MPSNGSPTLITLASDELDSASTEMSLHRRRSDAPPWRGIEDVPHDTLGHAVGMTWIGGVPTFAGRRPGRWTVTTRREATRASGPRIGESGSSIRRMAENAPSLVRRGAATANR